MISLPFHYTKPPGGTRVASFAGAAAFAGLALATGPVMLSITLVNTMIQQYINKSLIVHAIAHILNLFKSNIRQFSNSITIVNNSYNDNNIRI